MNAEVQGRSIIGTSARAGTSKRTGPPAAVAYELECIGVLTRELALRNCALDASTTQFMIVDAMGVDSQLVYVNKAVVTDFGHDAGALLHRNVSFLLPRDLNLTQYEQLDEAMSSGGTVRTEMRARRKDGTVFWVGIFLGPIRGMQGRITHYVIVGADITARLAEEQSRRRLTDRLYGEMQERERIAMELRLAQKLEAVGRLAAGVAHEINTPVQYIGDSVQFLRSAIGDLQQLLSAYRESPEGGRLRETQDSIDVPFLIEQIPRAFDRTLDGIARVAAIVRAMREFAHPHGPEQSPADLNRALETTLTVAHSEYKYIAALQTQFGELPEVTCNIGELNQVFLNLVVNAAHAIEQAGKNPTTGRILVSTAASGEHVTIVFADNGCGIPDDSVDKIFEPFFTTKGVGKGTGQGLAIARSIVVEKHGGSIDVQTAVGSGTRFIIRLPVAGRVVAAAA